MPRDGNTTFNKQWQGGMESRAKNTKLNIQTRVLAAVESRLQRRAGDPTCAEGAVSKWGRGEMARFLGVSSGYLSDVINALVEAGELRKGSWSMVQFMPRDRATIDVGTPARHWSAKPGGNLRIASLGPQDEATEAVPLEDLPEETQKAWAPLPRQEDPWAVEPDVLAHVEKASAPTELPDSSEGYVLTAEDEERGFWDPVEAYNWHVKQRMA